LASRQTYSDSGDICGVGPPKRPREPGAGLAPASARLEGLTRLPALPPKCNLIGFSKDKIPGRLGKVKEVGV